MRDNNEVRKSSKLYKNLVYDFDVFVRAATMIQSTFKSYKART